MLCHCCSPRVGPNESSPAACCGEIADVWTGNARNTERNQYGSIEGAQEGGSEQIWCYYREISRTLKYVEGDNLRGEKGAPKL